MTPFRYTVTCRFADSALSMVDDWLAWMQTKHLADVQAAGALSAELIELDTPDARTFEVRYSFSSREAFAAYERDHAPRLRAEGLERFTEPGLSYSRATGHVVMRLSEPSDRT